MVDRKQVKGKAIAKYLSILVQFRVFFIFILIKIKNYN